MKVQMSYINPLLLHVNVTPQFCTLMTLIIILTESASVIENCDTLTQNLTCPWQNMCHDEIACYCDKLCEVHGDCCPNFKPIMTLNYPLSLKISCKFVNSISDNYISIIDSCPNGFDGTTMGQKCESGLLSQGLLFALPVSDTNGLLFQNIFCALCNGIQNEDILFWRTEIVCFSGGISNITEVRQAIENQNCSLNYKPPNDVISMRECHDVTSTCPSGYHDECTKFYCEQSNFVRHVYTFYQIYKNEHCAKCNIYDPDYPLNFECRREPRKLPEMLKPISITMDFSGDGKVGYKEYRQILDEPDSQTCEPGFLFDIIQNECILVYCAPEFVLDGEKCIGDCARRVLSPSEYQLFENGTVMENSGQVFNSSQYEDFGNGTIGVCITIKESKFTLKFDKAQTIFSVVGQCISIVCLIVHLAVYSILPQLRNSPGKSLMALVSSLLSAQVLFLVGVEQTEPYGLCVTIGVFIHYSFLASFFWMGVMSFDIWATFSESNMASSFHHHSNRFLKYCIVGFGGPLLIIVSSLIVNYIENVPDHFKPAYGDGLCWIVHKTSLIIFFGTPLFSIIFVNILLYCLTLRAFYNISQDTRQIQTDASERQRFLLYVKLSVIVSLTWVFGLIVVFVDIPVLWYIFLFFNTLQGAFICISFIFTKKVIGLLKDKFKRKSGTDGTKSTDLQ